jgi:hypothetical protein
MYLFLQVPILAVQTKEGDTMALEIKYNGKTIATLEKGQTATIPCDGKKMATDIVVSISNSGGNDEIDTAGLYDAEDNLVASWDTLTNTYGLDVEKEYTGSTYETDTASPYYIFANSSELAAATKMIIPEGITKFGNYSFRKCSNLTTVTIPNSVTAIGNFAFADCTGLTDIVLPHSVTTIGSGAFARCSNLTVFEIPEGVTVIDGRVFSDCSSLSSISIPNSVSSIGASAFYRCRGLTAVKLPDGIVSIGMTAFQECSNLASIIIPGSISSIELSVFAKCTSLSDVYYKGNKEQWDAIDIGTGNEPLTNATIHYNYVE